MDDARYARTSTVCTLFICILRLVRKVCTMDSMHTLASMHTILCIPRTVVVCQSKSGTLEYYLASSMHRRRHFESMICIIRARNIINKIIISVHAFFSSSFIRLTLFPLKTLAIISYSSTTPLWCIMVNSPTGAFSVPASIAARQPY